MTASSAFAADGGTVLLVDDEEGVRSYCRRVLEAEGARVVEAPDGTAALRLVQLDEPPLDLVVTDILMPGLGGREVAEVLSIFRPNLPVLGISADGGATTDRRLRILQKPFTPEQLLEAIGRERRRSRQVLALAEEKRARARLIQEAAMVAQHQSLRLLDRIDLVAAAIELRRRGRNGRGSG